MRRRVRPPRALVGLCLVVLLLVPAAIALACNPQVQLAPDEVSYTPGESIMIVGSYFPPDLDLRLQVPGDAVTVRTSPQRSFTSSALTAPRPRAPTC